jgi:hypothetical protein
MSVCVCVRVCLFLIKEDIGRNGCRVNFSTFLSFDFLKTVCQKIKWFVDVTVFFGFSLFWRNLATLIRSLSFTRNWKETQNYLERKDVGEKGFAEHTPLKYSSHNIDIFYSCFFALLTMLLLLLSTLLLCQCSSCCCH